MEKGQFGITEEGIVYRWNGLHWEKLGHIAYIDSGTHSGRQAREWWTAQLNSGCGIETIFKPEPDEKEPEMSPVSEDVLGVGSSLDLGVEDSELVEAL